jgi:SAM-dependent methyltransferase
MIKPLLHDLTVNPSRDEKSRQEFVSSLRGHILVDMATSMNQRFDEKISPQFSREHKRPPKDGPEVHRLMKNDQYFKFYSSVRYNTQEMVWRSVIPAVERELDTLINKASALRADTSKTQGSLSLDPSLEMPRNVTEVEVHLVPGSYHTEYAEDDIAAGAVYDNGLNIFAANFMGRNLDDIGITMSNYVRLKFPHLKPQKILDCGCTIGHNSAAWAQTFPDAEVDAIDVSAPQLRYANARAQAQQLAVNFKQMNATALDYEDNSFDVVFTSMFLHELPLNDIHAFLTEAYRVLKPGGLLLNMELPPNDQMAAYDSFYLDWDCYYNQEPFYKCFRDQSYPKLCSDAGFADDKFVQLAMPQYSYMPEADFISAINSGDAIDDKTGRLTDGVQWYGFGAWK